MSKKKSFSGSTMTLKDFHGGSIPSDLPLPSAPGITVRPPDRPGYDRPAPGPWGPSGRPDLHRPRPGSAGGGGSRGLDERGPSFLSHAANIGRHFDEDERKPFDAASAPRRPIADPVRSPPAAAAATKRPVAHHPPAASIPAFHPPSGNVGSAPNAWASRKEAGGAPPQAATALSTTVWSGPAAASRFAQASAIEVVTSGRWHSKPPSDVEVVRFHGMEGLDQRFGESVRIGDDGDHDYQRERARSLAYPETRERNSAGFYLDGAHDTEKVRSLAYPEANERNSAVFYQEARGHETARSSVYPEPKERNSAVFYLDGERVRSPMYPEAKERSVTGFYRDGSRPTSSDNRSGGPQLLQQGMVDVLDRPKLKLFPRTRPVESSETLALDEKQGYEELVHSVHIDIGHEMHDSMNMPKPASAGSDTGSRAVERPRLNLKPRSQPAEQSDETAERERKSVFGGARPRELVLKERGIDYVDANNFDAPLPATRVKIDSPKNDLKLEPATEQRSGRDLERKDYKPDADKGDAQRSTWKNDNRRNSREIEKPLEPRRQEPDTWRKPVEQPKLDAPGPRPGKAASALELAQAFSRSVSDDKPDNHFTSQRSLPGRTQVPFSRLTESREFHSGPTQRQINGY